MKRGLEWGVRVVQHEPPLQHSVETQKAALSYALTLPARGSSGT
jgi:hypothetical protein